MKSPSPRSPTAGRRAGASKLVKLQERLEELEATLEAIRSGAVDALVISGQQGKGERVFTLEGADHRYRRLVETMNEGAAVVRPDGLIVYCNSRFAAMLGRAHERVLGASLFNLVTVGSRSTATALVERAERGTARAEVEMLGGRGEIMPVYLSATPNDAEEIIGISMIATDLTDQRRNERIFAAERLAASIIDQ